MKPLNGKCAMTREEKNARAELRVALDNKLEIYTQDSGVLIPFSQYHGGIINE